MSEYSMKILCCLLLIVVEIHSMALKGPVLTRYDPCGLGVIHFDKIVEKFWQGTVNLGLYTNLPKEVTFNINFEHSLKIYGASPNSTVQVRNHWHNYTFQPKNPIPTRYVFFIKLDDNTTDVPIVNTFTLNNVKLCNAEIKATQGIESLNVTQDDRHYSHVCGRRSLDHAELTSLKTVAQAGDWPWHVAIFIRTRIGNTMRYQCGGNIISRTAILTAGHCVSKNRFMIEVRRIVIVAGINNYTDDNQIGRQSFIAEKVILHPNYVDMESTADLAVIKVNKFTYNQYVQPICLWGPVYDKSNLFGYQATVVGFGATEDNKPSNLLRSAYTLVQNDTTCINSSPKLYSSLLNEFTFCAGYGPTSIVNPRNGDSGGGLVVPTMQPDHKISWFLRGVLSKCGVAANHTECDPKYYVVYTDVGPHYGWIYHHSGLQFTNNIVTY